MRIGNKHNVVLVNAKSKQIQKLSQNLQENYTKISTYIIGWLPATACQVILLLDPRGSPFPLKLRFFAPMVRAAFLFHISSVTFFSDVKDLRQVRTPASSIKYDMPVCLLENLILDGVIVK